MQLINRTPHFSIPFRRIAISALLSFALVLVAVISGFIAATYPPNIAVAVGGLFGTGAIFISAMMVSSKTIAPEKLMRSVLNLLLFAWVVWPSYITYKFGPLPGVNPTRIIYWGLIAFWVYWVIASGRLKQQIAVAFTHHKLFLTALLAFPTWQIICSFTGEAVIPSIYFAIKASLGGLLLFFVAVSILRKREHIESMLTWVLAAALVVALIGLLEAGRGSNPFIAFLPSDPDQLAAMDWIVQDKSRSGAYRISSTFAHPLTLGEYLLMCIPIAGCMAAIGTTKLRRLLAIVYLPISTVAIYATHTRSTMVGVGILFIIIFTVIGVGAVRNKSSFKRAVAGTFLLVGVLLGAIAVGAFSVNMAQGRDRGEQGSTQARLIQLDIGSNAVASSPIVGYGPGMAALKIGYINGATTLTIDNHYLSVSLDTGLPGLLLYCCIFMYPIIVGVRFGISGLAPINLMTLATSVALIAFSFEKIVLSLTHNFDFAYILIAMTLVLENISQSTQTVSSEQA